MHGPYFDVAAVLQARRRKRTQNTWGNFLRARPWSHYITLTFDRGSSADKAWEKLGEWLKAVQQSETHAVNWFAVLEVGRYGRTHFHVLLNAAKARVRKLELLWPYGHRQVRLYDPSLGGAHYVCKLLDDPDCEYDLAIHEGGSV